MWDVDFCGENRKVPFQIADGNFRIVFCPEHINSFVGPVAMNMPKQMLAQFRREGYLPMFTAFPVDFEGKQIQVYVFRRKPKHLIRSKPRVKNGKRHKVSAKKILRTIGPIVDNSVGLWP